jgi:serine/threonine protein kinase
VTLDHLALGAGANQALAGLVERAEPLTVRGLGAELLADRAIELAATARDELVREHEPSGSRRAGEQCRACADRGGDRLASHLRASAYCVESRLRLACISDGNCEISAANSLVANPCIAHGSQSVAVLRGHITMLHWRSMVHAGDAPIDRYVVLEHLSEGGMGAIYVGKKLGAGGFEMEVVLKQLLPEFTQQEEFIDLFLREAKLSATLDHANIVHTIDLVTAGGEYFIVMEYLPGGDLRTLLKKAKRRGKRFSPAAAIYISREILSALSYAHSKRDFDGNPLKLIHRDVSPSNVLLSYAGEVKLTDFGIAKAATHTSLFYKVKGKIGYMSPEQAKSEPLDHRSDLYSLAVCMYEILTGERLFVHAGLTTSADEIYSQPVPQVSKKVPGLTPELDAIMKKALSIDPEKRYQTAGEFQEALMRCAHRNGLLMSAPELGRELREACGPTDQWRGDDDEDDDLEVPRAGTEVYDPGDDDDDSALEIGPSGPLSIHSIAARARSSPSGAKSPPLNTKSPPLRPKTEVGKFQGVELTSIINMMDLDDRLGSQPLVDLDSGPRQRPSQGFDSDPALMSLVQSLPPDRGYTPPTVEPSELMPTSPRSFVPPAPPQKPPPRARSPQQAQPASQTRVTPRKASTRAERSALTPWIVIGLIVVVAIVVTLIVAMSGPSLPAGK